MIETHTHTSLKLALTFTDAEGRWFSVPLEYNEDLKYDGEVGRFTTSTDIFGLLDKDSLQNIFVEVVVA